MKFNKYILDKDFIFKNNQIYLTTTGKQKIKKLKKLTGSRLGAALGTDSFRTPFQLWCEMLGFFVEDRDDFFLKAGTVIESKLRRHAEEKMKIHFVDYDPKSIDWDLFKDNPIFGGIPDGEQKDENGNVVSILEIKTAQMDKYKWKFLENQFRLDMCDGRPQVSKYGAGLAKWFKNGDVLIPENYKDQLSLYLYLRGITKGYFCVAFIKQEDYENPYAVQFVSEFNNYKNYDLDDCVKLSNNEHLLIWSEHNIDLESFKKRLKIAEDWYKNHVLEGVSPVMTTQDLNWFRYGYPNLI